MKRCIPQDNHYHFGQRDHIIHCRSNEFLIARGEEEAGGGRLVHSIILRPTTIIKAEKCISYACFWLQAHCIIYWIYLFFFLLPKLKSLKRRYRITQKFGLTHINAKNKNSLFGRTLLISFIMLQWTCESLKAKIYWKLKVYESRYMHRAKISTEKLFQASIV